MSDIRPPKARNDFLLKVTWETKCGLCLNILNELSSHIKRPPISFEEKEFFVVERWYHWKCEHSSGEPYIFESVYGKRKTTT